jgi:hypothetical protein
MWYSGIDQHKQFCVITTYGSDGPRVKQARVASTPLALQQYCAEFPGPHRAVVESTGGWYWLADTLAPGASSSSSPTPCASKRLPPPR